MTTTAPTARRIALGAACVVALALGAGCQVEKKQEERNDSLSDWFEGGPLQTASAETMQLTARVLAAKGQTEQAGFILDRLLAEFPDKIGTYTEGAEILLIQGRVSDAIKLLDRGLERFPGNPIICNDRGLCHLLNADLAAASADFRTAFDADPSDADYVANMALARALAGDEPGARSLWGRVLPPDQVEQNITTAREARPKFEAKPAAATEPKAATPAPAEPKPLPSQPQAAPPA
jgi:tetratricopeptide (TPR) repeat protein